MQLPRTPANPWEIVIPVLCGAPIVKNNRQLLQELLYKREG